MNVRARESRALLDAIRELQAALVERERARRAFLTGGAMTGITPDLLKINERVTKARVALDLILLEES